MEERGKLKGNWRVEGKMSMLKRGKQASVRMASEYQWGGGGGVLFVISEVGRGAGISEYGPLKEANPFWMVKYVV
jgi:hypothetical protein